MKHASFRAFPRSPSRGVRALRPIAAACAFALALPSAANAAGPAGLLTGGATKLEPLTLSVVGPLAKAPLELESGQYYSLDIVCDGSGELALEGAAFFRNIWVDEVVIEDIEVRPLGVDSIEFDDAGTVTLRFIAVRPGDYTLSIPGSTGESQRVAIGIR